MDFTRKSQELNLRALSLTSADCMRDRGLSVRQFFQALARESKLSKQRCTENQQLPPESEPKVSNFVMVMNFCCGTIRDLLQMRALSFLQMIHYVSVLVRLPMKPRSGITAGRRSKP